MTTKEEQVQEEKVKAQQDVEKLQGYLDNRALANTNNPNCDRCGAIFNMNNRISKNHLDVGLHKEIQAFEKTIMEFNEQERPLLDKLIKHIEDLVKEIYPDAVVVYAPHE